MKPIAIYMTVLFAMTGAEIAQASCEVDSPDPGALPLMTGDFPTTDGWRYKQFGGRKITYEDGTWERYNDDNTYEYSSDGTIWTAPSFRFYKNGFSCANFPIPRFQFYVVNSNEVFMIDTFGQRHQATIER